MQCRFRASGEDLLMAGNLSIASERLKYFEA